MVLARAGKVVEIVDDGLGEACDGVSEGCTFYRKLVCARALRAHNWCSQSMRAPTYVPNCLPSHPSLRSRAPRAGTGTHGSIKKN